VSEDVSLINSGTEVAFVRELLLEKLIVSQLIKEFPTFYGTRSFIAVFTRESH